VTPGELAGLLEQGALCLTGTARLARYISHEYARVQQEEGLASWPTPQVQTLTAWLDRCAAGLAMASSTEPTVWLRPRQELLLWRQVIEASPHASDILDLEHAAAQASAAWAHVAEWRIPLRDPAWDLAEDSAAFRDWAREFFRRSRKAGVQSRAQLPDAIVESVAKGETAVPHAVLLAGMLDRTPREAALIEAIERAGSRVMEYVETSQAQAEPVLLTFAGPHEERIAAALWAHRLLRANPARRLAIVVPDLRPVREEWEAVLARVFSQAGALHSAPPPYHLSLGRPLASAGVIQAALRLTAVAEPTLSVETASVLLLSPYLAGAREERIGRAWRSMQLRERRASSIPLLELGSAETPILSQRVTEWDGIRRELATIQTPSRWARQFSAIFRIFGWPGVETDSTEYQAIEALRGALSDLAALDAISGPVTARQSADQLTSIVGAQVFQVEDLGQPLQVLGAAEALSERFDAAWLAGFHDRAWPPPSQPLALVPVSLQRAVGLPRAVPDLGLERSRRATAMLLRTAPELTISHARADGEEPLLSTPMIAGVFQAAPDAPPFETVRAPEERVDDTRAPVYGAEEAKGGATLIRDQAACPFRSFAAHRLEAREFPEAELGLSAQERGIILHAAISNCWRQLKDLATLRATSDEQLAGIIRVSVRRAIQDCGGALAEPFDVRVREVEQQRLERLLKLWMDVERQREASFQVIERESAGGIEIGGVKLAIRIDRQDRLDDGRLVLIDYKSNAPSPNAWEGDRPDEPQAPLYAIATERPIAALAFGQLKRSEARFKGVADDAGVLPGIKAAEAPISRRTEAWRHTLSQLAAQYKQGFAAVDPKNAKVCENCHLPALCRVNEAPPIGDEESDDGA